MSDLPAETDPFIAELDAAVEAHMNWTRRILRCAVLHSTPGEDVLDPMAHTLCQKEAQRNRTLLYVVLIDVDHFKPINDTYGHLVGDMVLRHLAHTLKQSLRSDEPLYRYGGEEFLWLLKCKSIEEARKSARRVLASVGTTPVPIADDETLRLTITLGLARAGETEDLSSVIKRADMALYEGKRSGRNRYVIAEP